jgi:hypothetical protein
VKLNVFSILYYLNTMFTYIFQTSGFTRFHEKQWGWPRSWTPCPHSISRQLRCTAGHCLQGNGIRVTGIWDGCLPSLFLHVCDRSPIVLHLHTSRLPGEMWSLVMPAMSNSGQSASACAYLRQEWSLHASPSSREGF